MPLPRPSTVGRGKLATTTQQPSTSGQAWAESLRATTPVRTRSRSGTPRPSSNTRPIMGNPPLPQPVDDWSDMALAGGGGYLNFPRQSESPPHSADDLPPAPGTGHPHQTLRAPVGFAMEYPPVMSPSGVQGRRSPAHPQLQPQPQQRARAMLPPAMPAALRSSGGGGDVLPAAAFPYGGAQAHMPPAATSPHHDPSWRRMEALREAGMTHPYYDSSPPPPVPAHPAQMPVAAAVAALPMPLPQQQQPQPSRTRWASPHAPPPPQRFAPTHLAYTGPPLRQPPPPQQHHQHPPRSPRHDPTTPVVNDRLTAAFETFEQAQAAATAVDDAAVRKREGAPAGGAQLGRAVDEALHLYTECVRHFEIAKGIGPSAHVRALCESHIATCIGQMDMIARQVERTSPRGAGGHASQHGSIARGHRSPLSLRSPSGDTAGSLPVEPPKVQLSTTVRSPVDGDDGTSGDMILTTISTTLSENIYASFLSHHTLNTIRAMLEHSDELTRQIGDGPATAPEELQAHKRNAARLAAIRRMIDEME